MNLARAEHSATALSDGNVLVAGGYDCGPGGAGCLGFGGTGDCCGASSAELYETANNSWTFTAPATTGIGHTATSLANGAVLVTGGRLGILNNFELMSPEIYASQYPPDEPLVQPLTGGATATAKTRPVGPPLLTHVAETHRTWREGNASTGSSRRRLPPRGTTFSFTLSEQAKVGFAFVRREAGRRVRSRCVAAIKSNRRRPRCTRSDVRGTLTVTGDAGVDKLFFDGRVSRSKVLPPGEYSATIAATNALKESSAPQRLSFTILR
jgi:hypothetical protein